jgi:hypothetical protein
MVCIGDVREPPYRMYRMAGVHMSLQTFRTLPANPIGVVLPTQVRTSLPLPSTSTSTSSTTTVGSGVSGKVVSGSSQILAAGVALPSLPTPPSPPPYRASALAQAVAAANRRGSAEYYGLDGIHIDASDAAAAPPKSTPTAATAAARSNTSSTSTETDSYTRNRSTPSPTFVHR